MNRRQAAFQMSVEKLAAESLAAGVSVRFGRWTTKLSVGDAEFSRCWARFQRLLYRRGLSLYGIRVFEAHKVRGLHAHTLILEWDDWGDVSSQVQDCWQLSGGGRTWSVQCHDVEGAGVYLSKYLTKCSEKVWARRVGWMGGFKGTRQVDCEALGELAALVRAKRLEGYGRESYRLALSGLAKKNYLTSLGLGDNVRA